MYTKVISSRWACTCVALAVALLAGACATQDEAASDASPTSMVDEGSPTGGESPSPTSEELTRIRFIGTAPSIFPWCLYAAESEDFFGQNGLQVDKVLEFPDDSSINRAMLAGEGDLANATVGLLRQIDPEASSQPVAVIAGQGTTAHSLVGPASVEDFASLEGATIALAEETQPSAATATAVLNSALGEGNWTPRHISGGTSARLAAVEAGEADAAIAAAPYDALIEESSDDLHIIDYLGNHGMSDYQGAVFMASREWLDREPDAATAWVKSYIQGCEWVNDPANKEAAISLLSSRTEVSESAAARTYTAYLEGQFAGETPPADGRANRDALINVAEVMIENGILETDVPAEDLIDELVDDTFWERAMDELS